MKKNKFIISSLSIFLCIVHLCCDTPEGEVSIHSGFKNTLGDESTGDGSSGKIENYFYNFDEDINASFFRYPQSLFGYDYGKYYNQFQMNPPLLTYKTFPEFLLSMKPEDKIEFTKRHYLDSLSVKDSTIEDSITITSSQFKNLESLEWDLDAEPSQQRYKLKNSNWIQGDTVIRYDDIFDVKAYRAVVDTPFIETGVLFVDSSEWRDTNYTFLSEDKMKFTSTFQFKRKQLSADSLVFRENTDCNDNGIWDQEEIIISDYNNNGKYEILFEFSDENNNGSYDVDIDTPIEDYNSDGSYGVLVEYEDRANGIWDPAEAWYDINQDGKYDLNEPYEDRNCNDKWDDAEMFDDTTGNGFYDLGEPFEDKGNGIYDNTEEFILRDLNGDGNQEKLLYTLHNKPSKLLFDWSDRLNPVALLEVSQDDSLVDVRGNVYKNIIEEVDFVDYQEKYINDVDSIVTLYTREPVGHVVEDSRSPQEYFITKSEWDQSSINNQRGYNYHIFFINTHVNQLVYPSYFLPEGFYYRPDKIDDGFWHKNRLENEVIYFTSGGILRDGEQVDTAYYDTTEVAVYFIEKSYTVKGSSVTVPAAKKRYDSNGVNSYNCLYNNTIVSDPSECPAVDTTFSDCFEITRHLTMTMIGSGVEFGQRTKTWLARNHGVVKSEVHVRWTEHPFNSDWTKDGVPDSLNEAWVGLSRLELNSIEVSNKNGILGRLLNPKKKIDIKEIDNIPDFNFDSLRVSTQSGLNTIDLKEFK